MRSASLPLSQSFGQRSRTKIRASAKTRCFAGETPVTDFSGPTVGSFDEGGKEGRQGGERANFWRAVTGDLHMNPSNESRTETGKVEAYRVSEQARLGTLPRHFGRYMMTVEGKIYDLMREFSADYTGGYWHFFELNNGGFYMAPTFQTLRICIPSNGYEGQMSGDAAGVMVCLFAFSHLSFQYREAEVFSRHFHRLRDLALGHAEAIQIFAAID